MKKREQGILTVEASIVLTLFMLFVLFLFSFVRIYRAQNAVSHATLQASDDMALESYLRENARDDQARDVVYLASRLTGSASLSADSFESLRTTDIPSLAREKFIAAIADSEAEADARLKKLGVKDGISGLDFSGSRLDSAQENVIVSVAYTVKVQFPVFGGKEINVTKSSKSKTFGEVMNEITVVPNDEDMGTASGSGNYSTGTVIQISASPYYGYKFVRWDDGDTSNPRSVTVNGAKKYVAIFDEDGIGITLKANPEGAGQLYGGKKYEYKSTATVSTVANPGYTFKDWTVYSHRDKTTYTEKSQSVSRIIDQSYTFTANFKPNPYVISVAYECPGATPAVSVMENNNHANRGTAITILYGGWCTVSAPAITNYKFLGWREKGSSTILSTSYSYSFAIPPRNACYVAVYEKYCQVSFDSAGGSYIAPIMVPRGSVINFNNYVPSRATYNFAGWYEGGTPYSGYCQVTHNTVLTAQWSCAHPGRYEAYRTGTICSGGTIYYRCIQCHCDMGTGTYGGTGGHDWQARCDTQHAVSYFNGYGVGGCQTYHRRNATGYCFVCTYCHESKHSGYVMWCGSHASWRSGFSPTNVHNSSPW